MVDIDLTVDDAAQILGLKPLTVQRWCTDRTVDGRRLPKKFKHARLAHGSRKFGYRIPASDVLAYARGESEELTAHVEREVAKRRAARGFSVAS